MDECYGREDFPTLQEAIEWLWASSVEEIEAVKFVLNKFFKLDEKSGKYIQNHIQEVLIKYHATCDINKGIADEREKKKRAAKDTERDKDNTNRPRTADNFSATKNKEQRTTNKEPLNNTNTLDNQDIEFCEWMYELILRVVPKAPKPNYKKWAVYIRRMRKINKYDLHEMAIVFLWANSNDFWCTNIRSSDKFRKQYPVLHAQMMREGGKNGNYQSTNRQEDTSTVGRNSAKATKRIAEIEKELADNGSNDDEPMD